MLQLVKQAFKADFLLNLELSSGMYNNDPPIEVLVEIVLVHEGREDYKPCAKYFTSAIFSQTPRDLFMQHTL